MAALNGTATRLKINDTTLKTIVKESTISLSVAVSEIPVTSKDSGGWEEVIGGLRSWNLSGELVLDWAADVAKIEHSDLYDMVQARDLKSVSFTTGVTGHSEFTGSVLFLTFDISAPMEDKVTISFTGKGSGQLTRATIA